MKRLAEKSREQKIDNIPSIDYNSRQIILNKRKKEFLLMIFIQDYIMILIICKKEEC